MVSKIIKTSSMEVGKKYYIPEVNLVIQIGHRKGLYSHGMLHSIM